MKKTIETGWRLIDRKLTKVRIMASEPSSDKHARTMTTILDDMVKASAVGESGASTGAAMGPRRGISSMGWLKSDGVSIYLRINNQNATSLRYESGSGGESDQRPLSDSGGKNNKSIFNFINLTYRTVLQ